MIAIFDTSIYQPKLNWARTPLTPFSSGGICRYIDVGSRGAWFTTPATMPARIVQMTMEVRNGCLRTELRNDKKIEYGNGFLSGAGGDPPRSW